MVLDELRQIEIAQTKFKKITGLIIGIFLIIIGIIIGILGLNRSKGELILIALIAFLLGLLLVILSKIGLNLLKRQEE
jgi:ABC-type Na+ efflux pump permease subunit